MGGVRARHDGARRNPWNEFECGSHYARSMASWAVLTVRSGYSFDLTHKALGFAPRLYADDWRSFWSAGSGWGAYAQVLGQGSGEVTLRVAYGALELEELVLGSVRAPATVHAVIAGQAVPASAALQDGQLVVSFPPSTRVPRSQTLKLSLVW